MTQDEVLELFRVEAETSCYGHVRKDDTIQLLARVMADSTGRLSKENFDALAHIGGLMYKDSLMQVTARSDVSEVMHRSHVEYGKPDECSG